MLRADLILSPLCPLRSCEPLCCAPAAAGAADGDVFVVDGAPSCWCVPLVTR
ncbi:MAG: hypothetical protein NZM94_08255 [Roseiflexus sp.]|nr:hypothetical protein [Roseiflexus sp.]